MNIEYMHIGIHGIRSRKKQNNQLITLFLFIYLNFI